MTRLLLFCLTVLLFSCNQEKGRQTETARPAFNREASVASIQKEDVPVIITRIRKISEIQTGNTGVIGGPGENYRNYWSLKENADISTLVKLTGDSNAAVACYAAWGLIDESYPGLPAILKYFLQHDRAVKTQDGCMIAEELISSLVYLHYFENMPEDRKHLDRMLFALDSVILYQDSPGPLVRQALNNRIYPASFNKQIAYLAFEKKSYDAFIYLHRWERSAYRKEIISVLLKDLEQTNFADAGVGAYYETVERLLQFFDPRVYPFIFKKMRKDRKWNLQREMFLALLKKYDTGQYDQDELSSSISGDGVIWDPSKGGDVANKPLSKLK